VFVHLNCGVRPRSFPRTIDLPTFPHPAPRILHVLKSNDTKAQSIH